MRGPYISKVMPFEKDRTKEARQAKKVWKRKSVQPSVSQGTGADPIAFLGHE
jgi:hypothetical protein